MDSITFFLDFPLPTQNEMIRTARGNKYAAAAQKKKYTDIVAMEIMVQTERPHFEAISLDITWIETKKKRDPDNVFAAVKFILDGIVVAGIIPDDDRDHVASITNHIVVSDSRGVVVLVTSIPKPLYRIGDTYYTVQCAQKENNIMTPNSAEKRRIRKRDQQNIPLSGVCERCGANGVNTTRHHLWYPKQFDPNAVIEVCDDCDDKIHGREDSESLGRTINAIRDLTIINGDVWLGGSRIGVADIDDDGTISIDMQKR